MSHHRLLHKIDLPLKVQTDANYIQLWDCHHPTKSPSLPAAHIQRRASVRRTTGISYRVRVTVWVKDPEELTFASLQLSRGGKRHAIVTHTKEAKYALYRPVWRDCPERWIDAKVVFPGRIFYEF